jgi:hypothetical protein
VVCLGVHGESPALQAADDRRPPQRAGAIEQATVQPGQHAEELTVPARSGQPDHLEVVVEVDLHVVGPPHRRGAATRLPRVTGEDRRHIGARPHLRENLLGEVVAGVGRRLEDLQRGDVHRMPRRLQLEHDCRFRRGELRQNSFPFKRIHAETQVGASSRNQGTQLRRHDVPASGVTC